MAPTPNDDTMRQVIGSVYAAGLRPLGRRVATRWRSVRHRPVAIVFAATTTITSAPVAALYVLLATVVPLTVAFLLTITAPVLLWVAVSNLATPRDRR